MTVQSILCLTNWYVGKRIKEDVLYNKRAEYGKQVIINLLGLILGNGEMENPHNLLNNQLAMRIYQRRERDFFEPFITAL